MKWSLSFSQLVILSTTLLAGSVFADQLDSYIPHPEAVDKQVRIAARFKLQDRSSAKSIKLEKLDAADKEQLRHSNSTRQTKGLQIGIGRNVPFSAVNSTALNWQNLPAGGKA
ncbi:MAG TPA: hypothetical protein VNW52_10685, partial [Burkholderiaceae bacterium]|nr:hypothetical protein [Burkholderiaceae bacterium]